MCCFISHGRGDRQWAEVFVGLTHNPTVLDVPDTWARLVGEPGLLVMFESSLFQGLSGCTPLDRLLAVVTR